MSRPLKSLRGHARGKPIAHGYQLKVTLQDVEPAVWRQILVPGNISLDRLHAVIQKAMGWTDSHLHEFVIHGRRYGRPVPEEPDLELEPEWKVTLREVAPAPGLHFKYVYDFGDNWTHKVFVESIAAPDKEARDLVCLAGARACPPEDCGGASGYVEFLEAIRNPEHPRHDEMLDWVGAPFDSEAFNLTAVNRTLRRLK